MCTLTCAADVHEEEIFIGYLFRLNNVIELPLVLSSSMRNELLKVSG